jgi:glutathione synthase/RimK-type ligase-like ATP-grasp enzyme
MSVLIISTSQNAHANAVEKTLHDMREEVRRINMDRVCEDTTISFSSDDTHTFKLALNGCDIKTADVTGVFFHQAHISIPDEYVADETDRILCKASWGGVLSWIETCLDTARWLNRPSASRISSSNAKQLTLAACLGLPTPQTVFTNDLSVVKRLAIHGKVVLKTGALPGLQLDDKSILTQLIDTDILTLSDMETSPCLFQTYIEKSYELRVYVVRDNVFTCKIESQANERTKTDWRRYNLKETPHYAHKLSADVEEKCQRIVQDLGLEFGAIDLIVTPTGETVFLECNTQGHWLWIEELTGLPITQAVCSRLAGR